jgi:HTH-type transcriptional regulator / antitoxin HigA
MSLVPIRTQEDHRKGTKRLEKLMTAPKPDANQIEILSVLLASWEQKQFLIEAPSAIEAIRFRMERGNLKPRDLEPIIGSRSRVSEILAGSRPLTVDMIRALNLHWGIPAAALIRPSAKRPERIVAPSKPAMDKLRSFGVLRAKESFEAFVARAFRDNSVPALLRKTRTGRTNAKSDPAALQAWCAAVQLLAEKEKLPENPQKKRTIAEGRKIAQLSACSDGLYRVRDGLKARGIALVLLDHLPGTYLDGAAMCRQSDGAPIIALTRRHDRLDNFWFTLLHEYMHVACHLNADRSIILDDLEVQGEDKIEE